MTAAEHKDSAPSPEWFQEVAVKAEERLRATPREHLGPAGRLLMRALDGCPHERGVVDRTAGEPLSVRCLECNAVVPLESLR